MKRLLFAIAGMLLIGLGIAPAQVIVPIHFTADSPFYVGKTLLSAGTYQISPIDRTDVFEIRGLTSQTGCFFTTMPKRNATPANFSSVTFDKYGETLILKTVTEEGEPDAVTLYPSPLEKSKMKEFGSAAEVVIPAIRVSKKG